MKSSLILLSLLFISGCSAFPLNPEAESVKLVLLPPDSPKCKFLGEVTSSDGGDSIGFSSFRGAYSTYETLVESAKNRLRNKTYLMGGNFVFLNELKNPNDIFEMLGGNLAVVKMVASGKAYRCDKDFNFNKSDSPEVKPPPI